MRRTVKINGQNEDLMELGSLLKGLEFTCVRGNPETEVTGIVYDSRKVKKGLSFCLHKGDSF